MGRPPIGKIAMTAAERVRRYRLRHGTDKPVTKPVMKRSADKTTGLLKARIRDLEAEIDDLKRAARRKPPQTPAKAKTKTKKAKEGLTK